MESQEVEEKIKTLAKWVGESQNMAFITKSMIFRRKRF